MFSPIFRDSCHRYLFSMKSFIPDSVNRFSDWKLFSFVQRSFLLVETVSESSESQYLKRDHILTNVTDVLVSRNDFSFIFLDSSEMLQMEAVYSRTNIFFSHLVDISTNCLKNIFQYTSFYQYTWYTSFPPLETVSLFC